VWLSHHVPTWLIAVWSTLLSATAYRWVQLSDLWGRGNPSRPLITTVFLITALCGLGMAVPLGSHPGHTLRLIAAIVYASALVIPLATAVYLNERATHKECPDCCERVKAKANVCRYCGYRFGN